MSIQKRITSIKCSGAASGARDPGQKKKKREKEKKRKKKEKERKKEKDMKRGWESEWEGATCSPKICVLAI